MRSGVASVLVLGACQFHAAARQSEPPPDVAVTEPPGGPPDARLDAGGDAAAPAPFCDPADPHLVACFSFEGGAIDGSSHHLQVTTSGVSFHAGRVGSALQLGPTSSVRIADSPVLDVTTLTIEAWIQPAQIPGSGRAGILDVDRQYGFFLYPGSMLSCTLGGGPTVTAVPTTVAADHWSHVACTYDRAHSIIYVDGVELARATGTVAPSITGTTGLSIGADNPSGNDHLLGLLDQLRVMDVARTASEICANAGRPACP